MKRNTFIKPSRQTRKQGVTIYKKENISEQKEVKEDRDRREERLSMGEIKRERCHANDRKHVKIRLIEEKD